MAVAMAMSGPRGMSVVGVDAERNLLLVRGVPGPRGGYVMIKETNKL